MADADADLSKSLDLRSSSSLDPTADDLSAGEGGLGGTDAGGIDAFEPVTGDGSTETGSASSPGMWSTNSNDPSLWSSLPPPLPSTPPLPPLPSLAPPPPPPEASLDGAWAPEPVVDATSLSKDPLLDAEIDASPEAVLLAAKALVSRTRKVRLEPCACSIVPDS